jgi:hypothetical protein
LYVSSSLASIRRNDLEHDDFELLFVEIKVNSLTFVCSVCYRPPNYNSVLNDALLDHLQFCVDSINARPGTFVLLLGDFNAHFDVNDIQSSSDFGINFYRWMECNSLFQVINEPTRITAHGASILDLIITNSPGYFVNSGTLSPPYNCDHSLIYARINISFAKQKCYKRHIWDLAKVDSNTLCQALSEVNWDKLFQDVENVDDLYNKWFNCFEQVLKTFVPHRTVVIRPRDKPWMTSEIRRAIRKRNRLLKVFGRLKNPVAWENYRLQRNYTTSLIRSSKERYFANLNVELQNPNIGQKKWWGLVKSLYGNKIQSGIPTLIENDRLIIDAREKAEIFNEYFSTQCRLENTDSPLPNLITFQNTRKLSDISTCEQEVKILLNNADVSKACGVDGVGNFLIKASANGIANSFSRFINISLSRGIFPFKWKLANVIPIFKKDDRQSKLNYRPVSLLISLSKIMEKIVFTRLYNFLLEIQFLNRFQSGFRPGDSTVNQLILIVHKIYEALESGKEVRMVFLDISKAFDKVWHRGLIYKLELLGVEDPLLKWIKSYLFGRKQRVIIDGQSSDWNEIEAGVPQGSVLGPLLFLIYINDITQDLQCDSFLYADDTSLLEVVEDIDISAERLNNDLQCINEWTRDWHATINTGKTKSVTFSAKMFKQAHPTLYFANEPIEIVSNHKHLGVTLSSNLSWRAHILNIYEKASKKLNLLKRFKFKLDRETLSKLYKSLIRPVMEYADVLWDGCSENESDLIEHVQYQAATVVVGAMKGTSRVRLLEELAWEDMKTRRSIHKLILYFKIVNKLTPNYLSDLLPQTVQQRSGLSLRNASDFSPFGVRTERFKKSFFPSTTILWNNIDIIDRNSKSIGYFKSSLTSFFDIQTYTGYYDFSIDRYSSILHTRLRLNCNALNYYLFKINCRLSPACSCGDSCESVIHYSLYCPRYAALRLSLLSVAAQIYGEGWYLLSDSQKSKIFLSGSTDLSIESNRCIFMHVQKYIKQTNRFSKN